MNSVFSKVKGTFLGGGPYNKEYKMNSPVLITPLGVMWCLLPQSHYHPFLPVIQAMGNMVR